MLLIQLTGLSGAGKSTITNGVKSYFSNKKIALQVLDGDECRKHLCNDLGFKKEDRNENIRRLGFVGSLLSKNGIITILSVINPYEKIRNELLVRYPNVKTVWINCDLQTLLQRDTKGLYAKALLPDKNPEKIFNVTGINDPYETPYLPDLIINTHLEAIEESVDKLIQFIEKEIELQKGLEIEFNGFSEKNLIK